MIIVFGSLNADLVLSALEHARPGETVMCSASTLSPGGKGNNQAVAAARAGAEAVMVGRIGTDALGSFLIERLAENGVDGTHLVRSADSLTGCAVVAVDGSGQNLIYVASGANALALAADVPDDLLAGAKLVVCQMEVSAAENWTLLERAKQAGLVTVLNFAPARDVDARSWQAITQWVDVLIVNEEEAKQLARHQAPDLSRASPDRIAHALAGMLELTCIVTLGPAGVCGSDASVQWRLAALPVAVKDTTGAGDTFTGVFAAMLDRGLATAEALQRATIAASLACRGLGAQTAMPGLEEIERYTIAQAL